MTTEPERKAAVEDVVEPDAARRFRRPCVLALIIWLGAIGSGDALPRQTGVRAPSIEVHGGFVFGPHAEARPPGSLATYRVDAHVLLPLLLTSIPIASRSRVGFGHFYASDRILVDGVSGRAYEFFATSIPERARGFNRLGFLREVVQLDTDGAASTAYFGVISSSRDETRAEVEAGSDTPEGAQGFSVIDGLITRRAATNTVSYLELGGLWSDANQLYAEVGSRLDGGPADRAREIPNASGEKYGQPVAFLGGLQTSLREVTRTIAAGRSPKKLQQRYVHDGRILRFELREADVDTDRGARYLAAGWATAATAVYRLDYRVLAPDGDTIEDFTLWAELPGSRQLEPGDAIVPIAFEFKPRSYLRLSAERVATKPQR